MIGVVNGLVVGYLRLNPIIWTLAMMSVLSGVIRKAYAGRQVYPDESTEAGNAFSALYHAQLFGWLPLPIVLLAITAAAGTIIMWKTGFGARLKLTGSSYQVARMTGVPCTADNPDRVCDQLGQLFHRGNSPDELQQGGSAVHRQGYDFDAITAVVIGGMTLTGGQGNVPGVVGVLSPSHC